MEGCMNTDVSKEGAEELNLSQSSLRGPLILAKMVTDALEKQKHGVNTDYVAIIGHLSASQMKPVVMRRWLQALKFCVSQLTKDFDMLVGATLRLLWYDKEPDIVQLYIDYLANLISAQTFYLKSTLLVLIKKLWLPVANGECVHHNIHQAIDAILQLVPTAPSVLMPLLSKNYPFKGRGTEIQELALRNVLYLTTYCPTLRDSILELVIHQMLSIDVEVPRLEEQGGMNDEREADHEEIQFHVEVEPSSTECCHDNNAHSHFVLNLEPSYCQQQVMTNDCAEKLDIMITLCLEHMLSICYDNGGLLVDVARSLLHSLFKIFDRLILPTHACSHVQFLLFKLTSCHDSFPGLFLDFLWDKFQDHNTPTVLRQTSSAYIASYVARSKFIPLSTAKLCLSIMMHWIHQYIDSCSPDSMKPDVKLHGPLFSLCQAVFYIFVFRHKSLIETAGGIKFLRQLNFERVISSRLNPLKVCLPTVVEAFASITSHHEIVFCYTILEQNKRLILYSEQAPTQQQQDQTNVLDCFFPFDPFYLKRSAKFIHPLYQEWQEIEDMEDDDHSSMASSLPNSYHDNGHASVDSSLPHSYSMPSFSMSPR